MSSNPFVATSRFKIAIDLYNKTDGRTFEKMLQTIINRFTTHESTGTFSDHEIDQLKALFNQSSEELDIMVTGCSYIVDQTAYYNLTPEKLLHYLLELELTQDIAQIFAATWSNHRQRIVGHLRGKTFGTPKVLDSVHWKLQLTTSHQDLGKTKQLNTVMSLGLSDTTKSGDEKEHINLEFSKDQLLEFFNQLEIIQEQLDAVSK